MTIMQKIITGIAISGLFLIPGVSFAEHGAGYYFSGTANRLSANFDNRDDASFSDSDNVGGVQIGYMFDDYLGLELGFLDLGDFSSGGSNTLNRIDLDARAFTAALVLSWPILPYLNIYGKAGAFYIEADAASSISGISINANESAAEPFGAVGIETNYGPLNLFGEFSRVNTDINDLTVDIATVGIKYRFGRF